MFPCITDKAVVRLEPKQLDGKAASLVLGKLEGNAALAEPGQLDGKAASLAPGKLEGMQHYLNLGSLMERQLEVGCWN